MKHRKRRSIFDSFIDHDLEMQIDVGWKERQKFLRAFYAFGSYDKVAEWSGFSPMECWRFMRNVQLDKPYPPSWADPWTDKDAERLAQIPGAFETLTFIVAMLATDDSPSSASATFSAMIETTLRHHPAPSDPPSALYRYLKTQKKQNDQIS